MAHNIVYLSETDGSFKQFSTAELDELAERVLRIMASGAYTGSITIDTTNPIGTFTDTSYTGTVGQPADPLNSTTYTLSQITTSTLTALPDPPMYVGLDESIPGQTILKENMTTREQLAEEILSRMVAGTGGTNSYYLGSSAPSDGATWVSRGTLLDTRTNGTVTVTDYKLWQRTTSGTAIVSKNPLKITSDPLKMFGIDELLSLIKLIENRIVSTGIGTYALQETVPGTGTWANAGTIVDTREDVAGSSYEGTTTYINENAVSYETNYTLTTSYTNENAAGFVVWYMNDNYQLYTLTYEGPLYTTSYIGNTPYIATYLGPASYFQDTYIGITANYQGAAPTSYVGDTYIGPTINYVADNVTPFEGATFFGFPSIVFYDSVDYQGPLFDAIIPTAGFNPLNVPGFGYLGPYRPELTQPSGGPGAFTVVYTGPITYDGDVDYLTTYEGTESYDGVGNYDNLVVSPTTSTIMTRTLWRRIA